jgi:hypothetical protein
MPSNGIRLFRPVVNNAAVNSPGFSGFSIEFDDTIGLRRRMETADQDTVDRRFFIFGTHCVASVRPAIFTARVPHVWLLRRARRNLLIVGVDHTMEGHCD